MHSNSQAVIKSKWVDADKIERIYPFRDKKIMDKATEYLLFTEIKNGKNVQENINKLYMVYRHSVDNYLHSMGKTPSDEDYAELKDVLTYKFCYALRNYNCDTVWSFRQNLITTFNKELQAHIKRKNKVDKRKENTYEIDYNEESLSYEKCNSLKGVDVAKDMLDKALSILPSDHRAILNAMAREDILQSGIAEKVGCSRTAVSNKFLSVKRLFKNMNNVHLLCEQGLSEKEIANKLNLKMKHIYFYIKAYNFLNNAGEMPDLNSSAILDIRKLKNNAVFDYESILEERGE